MFLLAALLWGAQGRGQDGWEVNPPAFQYTMTVTGVGLFDCAATSNAADQVAAFINGECRGVAEFGTNVNGVQLAYLTVYDHVVSGSEVSFRLYDSATGMISDALEGVVFTDGGIVGNAAEPFRFRDQYALTDIYMPADSLLDYYGPGTEVSELFVVNENGDTTSAGFDFVTGGAGIDNGSFSILGAFLFLETQVEYAVQDTFQIHIQGITEAGCAVESVIVLPVINTNVPPQGLKVDTMEIAENLPAGTLVGMLEALDETPDDAHGFELFGLDSEFPDHMGFEIDGAELISRESFDYEAQKEYHLQVLITDLSGNSVVDTLVVNILDVIEFDDLKASNLLTPNADGFNDTFSVPNVHLFSNYVLKVYNAIGSLIYETRNYDNSWTGFSSRGTALPTGTYYYVFQDVSDESNRFKGEIHLYRDNKF